MITEKERMLSAARGQLTDRIPFAPRIDLWFHSNKERNTLPEQYKTVNNADEIALREGWALHKVVLEFMEYGDDAIIDRTLGVYRIPTQGFVTELPHDVIRKVERRGDEYHVEYMTPVGKVKGIFVFTEAMRCSGISVPWIKEHLIKEPSDYDIVGYIFENMRVEPAYVGYREWEKSIGSNGMPVAYALTAGSPMHHVMKILMDSTEFYYHLRDHAKKMTALEEKIGVYFRNVFEVVKQGPAEVVLIGANFDDMLTYPPLFKSHILPWLREAAEALHSQDKLLLCHTDGENKGLLDLITESGMDIADSVCPYPMTKVPIDVYYRKWNKKITIFGGIPSNLLLEEATSHVEFEAFMENFFKAIAPGHRFILGVADTVPPNASIQRLKRIHELVQIQGLLPIENNQKISRQKIDPILETPKSIIPTGLGTVFNHKSIPYCHEIRHAILQGNQEEAVNMVKKALDKHVEPRMILERCLLKPMDTIGERFTDGSVFIPEVLLSARALNESMKILEPYLKQQDSRQPDAPLVIIGTVKGDLHDIGKNLVGIMLKSVGFRVNDMGTNVGADAFVSAVANERPAVLAMSALLTTTMSEFVNVIDAVDAAGLRDQVKIMVGGAPVTERFASSIRADAYGRDAGEAARKAKTLITI